MLSQAAKELAFGLELKRRACDNKRNKHWREWAGQVSAERMGMSSLKNHLPLPTQATGQLSFPGVRKHSSNFSYKSIFNKLMYFNVVYMIA